MSDNEITAEEALKRTFASKNGHITLSWMAEQIAMCYPVTITSDLGGADPVYAAYRDGRMSAFREILELAGYRITYERMPDDDYGRIPDGYDTDGDTNGDADASVR